jgi:aryl-alcohol dehydrogenase-like predicted oxidoreductase
MKLALGTVQFGLNYGITNKSGQVQTMDVVDILSYAAHNDITILDTAAAYGNSENVLGELSTQRFDVISKIPSLTTLNKSITQCILSSLENLKRQSLYGLMFHDEKDLFSSKIPFIELLTAKNNGLVKKIGCSFYSIDALNKALDMNYDLDLIQVPTNCLDQRFIESGLLDEAKKRGIEVHCRSLFLQGLLLDNIATLPTNLMPSKGELLSFFKFCELHNITPLMATLKFLQQTEVIDYGVVGCISKLQLSEITEAYVKVNEFNKYIDFEMLSSTNTVLLNPTLWS